MMVHKIYQRSFLVLFFILVFSNLCLAQAQGPSASQIERSQEILEKEQALREKIEKEEKIYIKKIIIKGITLLSKEQIEKIILPFQTHWLTKKDIQRLIDSLKQAYQQESKQVPAVSYEVKGHKLIISVRTDSNAGLER